MFIQFKLVTMDSVPSFRCRNRGRRLMRKAYFTAVFTCVSAQFGFSGFGSRVVRTG